MSDFLSKCVWEISFSLENLSDFLFSKFVCEMSIFLLKMCLNCFQNLSAKCQNFSWKLWVLQCVWKMTMFLLKNCLNCFQTLSAKCFPESVSDHYQNLSAKLQYFSSKLVWIVFKICLRNNWQRWFNIWTKWTNLLL